MIELWAVSVDVIGLRFQQNARKTCSRDENAFVLLYHKCAHKTKINIICIGSISNNFRGFIVLFYLCFSTGTFILGEAGFGQGTNDDDTVVQEATQHLHLDNPQIRRFLANITNTQSPATFFPATRNQRHSYPLESNTMAPPRKRDIMTMSQDAVVALCRDLQRSNASKQETINKLTAKNEANENYIAKLKEENEALKTAKTNGRHTRKTLGKGTTDAVSDKMF